MIKNRKLLLVGLVGISIAAGIYVGQSVTTSNAEGAIQPGSADDPLVTKSYLDEQLKKLTGGQWTSTPSAPANNSGTPPPQSSLTEDRIKEIAAAEAAKVKQELQSRIDAVANGSGTPPTSTPIPTPTPSVSTGASAALEVIKLEAGQILYGGIGTEFIVRTGKTVAVSNDDGIPDVTAGKDIAAGAAIENNHLLIFPREGRGIKSAPNQKADIYVMVRGSYLLLKEDGSKTAP